MSLTVIRPLILSFALLFAPALAASYRAEPAAASALERFVARDNIWRCAGVACTSVNPAPRDRRSAARRSPGRSARCAASASMVWRSRPSYSRSATSVHVEVLKTHAERALQI